MPPFRLAVPAFTESRRRACAVLLALLAFAAPASLTAQPGPLVGRPAADTSRVWYLSAAPDSMVRAIVEFVEPPYYLAGTQGFEAAGVDVYTSRFDRLAADLDAAGGAGKTRAAARAEIDRTYYRVFFGASVRAPARVLASVAALPYVRRVSPDAPLTAFSGPGTARVDAAVGGRLLGGTGEGVTVGILDTGVDYTHPALGGAFGPGHKVAGGYDFVNDDADPMDDHGHGTHVAGIVAGDADDFRGVAPGVRLVVFKVLNANGRGDTSTLLRALERTVDPDGDGDLSDRLDVVNISLGSDFGTPDDPAAVALDHASRLGVTFVVAAGNRGDPTPTEGKDGNYFYDGSETVGSPGAARSAVTVGAVDRADAMAHFSSKGPVALTFEVKPDVTAPGVAIRSLALGSGYVDKDGTSMAAPHVAGVAALLKALHPAWTPAQLKAALVGTAVDGGHPVMRQGAGRVDAARALQVQTLALPSTLSFGMDAAAEAVWTRRQSVWVHNGRPSPQPYTVAATGERAGVTLAAAPAAFTVAAGDSAEVVFTLTVDNRVVPVVDEDIEVYGGLVRVSGAEDVLHLPWSFSRASVLALTFDLPEPRFTGIGPRSFFASGPASMYNKVRWVTPTRAEVYGVTAGAYHVGVVFTPAEGPPRIVLRENVAVAAHGGVLHVSAAEAVHPVSFEGVDEAGQPLRAYGGAQQALFLQLPQGRGWVGALASAGDTPDLLLSPVSPAVRLHPVQLVADVRGTGRVYAPAFASVDGLAGALRITNDPGSYVTQTLRFPLPQPTGQVKLFTELMAGYTEQGADYMYAGLLGVDTVAVHGDALEARLFVAPSRTPGFFEAPAFHVNFTDVGSEYAELSTPPLSVADGRILVAWPSLTGETRYRSPSGDTLTFGAAPVYILNRSYNNSFGEHSIHFAPLFFGGLREERFTDYTAGRYALYDEGGTLVREAPLAGVRSALEVAPGRYRLEITSENYRVRQQRGKVTLVNRFDLRQPVADAPYLFSLQLLNAAGKPTDVFRSGEAARLRFSARVVGAESSPPVDEQTRVYVRPFGTEEWLAVPVRNVGVETGTNVTMYEADLGLATARDSAGIDLRVEVGGRHDNTAELRLEPAFAVGPWQRGTDTEEPGGGELPGTPILSANYPNPFSGSTRIGFELPRPAFVTLAVYDLLGRRVETLVSEPRAAGRHEHAWDPGTHASGLYFYRLEAGGAVLTRKMLLVR